MRCRALRDFFGSPSDHEHPTRRATFRTEINDPVGAFDDFEIVLDDEQAVAFVDEALQQLHQQRDVIEVQAGGRFVEQEQAAGALLRFGIRRVLNQMPDELQALCFTAGKRVERLTELQVAKTGLVEHLKLCDDLRGFLGRLKQRAAEPRYRLLGSQTEHFMDAFSMQQDFQRMWLIAPTLALGTRHIEIAEELHLDLFVAIARAAFAAAFAGIEAEEARHDALCLRILGFGEQRANVIKRTEKHRWRRARRACQRRLIHHHDLTQVFMACDLADAAWFFFTNLTAQLLQVPVEHVMHQRRFAGAADARDAAEHAERDVHIELLEVVLARTVDLQIRSPAFRRFGALGCCGVLSA